MGTRKRKEEDGGKEGGKEEGKEGRKLWREVGLIARAPAFATRRRAAAGAPIALITSNIMIIRMSNIVSNVRSSVGSNAVSNVVSNTIWICIGF